LIAVDESSPYLVFFVGILAVALRYHIGLEPGGQQRQLASLVGIGERRGIRRVCEDGKWHRLAPRAGTLRVSGKSRERQTVTIKLRHRPAAVDTPPAHSGSLGARPRRHLGNVWQRPGRSGRGGSGRRSALTFVVVMVLVPVHLSTTPPLCAGGCIFSRGDVHP